MVIFVVVITVIVLLVIIVGSLFWVGQRVVGLADVLEDLLGLGGVVGVLVWVPLDGEVAVGLFYF